MFPFDSIEPSELFDGNEVRREYLSVAQEALDIECSSYEFFSVEYEKSENNIKVLRYILGDDFADLVSVKTKKRQKIIVRDEKSKNLLTEFVRKIRLSG